MRFTILQSVRSRMPLYWRNVSVVLMGTVVAQVLPLAVLPVLTRGVGAEQLGFYFLWLGIAGILTVAGTGRFDLALYTARTQQSVDYCFRLVVMSSALMAAIALMVASATDSSWLPAEMAVSPGQFTVSLILFAGAMAVHQAILAVLVYRSDFIRLGWAKVLLAGLVAILQLAMVLAGLGLHGLIYSQLLMTIVAASIALNWAGLSPLRLAREFSGLRLACTFKRNYRFPLYSMPADFINTLAAQLPLIVIAARFDSPSLGFFALTMRVLSAPIGLIANSILTVYKERAGREYRETGTCRGAYLYTLRTLVPLAIPPLLVIALFGEELFRFIFGVDWAQAGRYAQILTPLFFMRFIASPLSYTLYIAHRQAHDLVWQIVLLVVTWVSFSVTDSVETAVVAYSVGYSVMYAIYLWMSYQASWGVRHRKGG